MTYHNMTNLRLQIEATPEGLPNLIQNPSGDLGGWGWVTPVNNTAVAISVYTNNLQFTTQVAQAAHWTSEFAPLAAGRYVGARFDAIHASTNTNVKVRFEFYDANKALISSSPQSAAFNADFDVKYINATQAPANTAYVKIRFDLYRGTANPSAGDWFAFSRVMVTHAATVAEMGSTTRTNLVPNPSFETNLTGWDNGRATSGVSMTRTSVAAAQGSFSARLQQSGTAASFMNLYTTGAGTGAIPVTGGADYNVSLYIRTQNAPVQSRRVRIYPVWYTATGAFLATVKQDSPTALVNGAFTRHGLTYTAPSNAAYARVAVEYHTTTGNIVDTEYIYIDGVMLERGNSMGTYIQGTVATGTGYAFEDPYDWRNILGPTHEIKISRGGLDVGLMSASIKDALLDPRVSDLIRPGKKVRVQGYNASAWESIFEGVVSNAHVTYNKEKRVGSALETHIDLSASDAIAVLANQGESSGVANLNDIPYIMEGKGVPWNIVGGVGGNQVPSASVVSYNENASVLDQIAITRDSNHAYAFVSRNGVLTTLNAGSTQTSGTSFSDEGDETVHVGYTDIDVSFSTDECINHVTVNWLRYDIGSGSTNEIPYGPYRDPASISKWGARSATFTIHGATESASAIAAYAADVLEANATPTVKVNGMTFKVKDALTLTGACNLELMHRSNITWQGETYTPRIQSIEHTITPQDWTVSMSFASENSVAAPTWTPSPPFAGVTGTAEAGFIQMFAGDASSIPTGWLLCDGSTFNASQYPSLAAVVTDKYGAISGNLYRLPNLVQRFPLGGGGSDSGASGGSKKIATANLPAHSHTFSGTTANDGLHSHIVTRRANVGTVEGTYAGGGATNTTNNRTNDDGVHNHSFSGTTNNTGSGTDYMPPYVTVNFIIKV